MLTWFSSWTSILSFLMTPLSWIWGKLTRKGSCTEMAIEQGRQSTFMGPTNFTVVLNGVEHSIEKGASTNALLDAILNAAGVDLEHHQPNRVTKDQAKAMLIKARTEQKVELRRTQTKIKEADMLRRAEYRRVYDDIKHQVNAEKLIAKTLPQLSQQARPHDINPDWIANLFDKTRNVSDDDMQELWARILAGEANVPGTYSKRTVNALSDFDKFDADLFAKLCDFICVIEIDDEGGKYKTPLVFDERAPIYRQHGIVFVNLLHLDGIGLIRYIMDEGEMVGLSDFSEGVSVSYSGRRLVVKPRTPQNHRLSTGRAELTRVGRELSLICSTKPVEGFWEYMKDYWNDHDLEDLTDEPLAKP